MMATKRYTVRHRWAALGTVGSVAASLILCSAGTAQEVHKAAMAGDSAKVAALLDADSALLEARDGQGRTPLMAAAATGSEGVVRILLKRGADVNATDPQTGMAAVDYAFLAEVTRDDARVVRLLVSARATFDAMASVRGPVKRLDMAVAVGNLDMVRLLLECGADPAAPTGYPMMPLASAAARGNIEIVRALLSAGANPNDLDREGHPPVLTPVERGHADLVDILLSAGASASFVDTTTGQSLLHRASLGGSVPVVDRLLAAGADVRVRDKEGHDPLYYARRYGHGAVADRLLAAGADPGDPAAAPNPSSTLLHRPLGAGEAVLWYLAGRGWAIRTTDHMLVFDAEEFGLSRPETPSLSNGFLTPAEIKGMDVISLYTAYHGEPGEPAYIHQIEDSLTRVTYIQNAGDPWRGSARSVYLSPHADTTVDGAHVRTVEVTQEMTSLGYLVDVDGLVLYYAGFRADDPAAFAPEIDVLSKWTNGVDVAFLPIPEPGEDLGEIKLLLERLHPRYMVLLDPDRRETLYPEVAARLVGQAPGTRVFTAGHPGDAFVVQAPGGGG